MSTPAALCAPKPSDIVAAHQPALSARAKASYAPKCPRLDDLPRAVLNGFQVHIIGPVRQEEFLGCGKKMTVLPDDRSQRGGHLKHDENEDDNPGIQAGGRTRMRIREAVFQKS